MKILNYSLFLIAASVFIISSCTIEKRLYRPGFHIAWKNGKPASEKVKDQKQDEKKDDDNVALVQYTDIMTNERNSEELGSLNDDLAMVYLDCGVTDTKFNEPSSITVAPSKRRFLKSPEISEKQDFANAEVTKKEGKRVAPESTGSGKSQIVALLLCIFLGLIGIHRFYLGYTGMGVLYIFTVGLFGLGWLIDLILLIIPNGLTPKGKTRYRDKK